MSKNGTPREINDEAFSMFEAMTHDEKNEHARRIVQWANTNHPLVAIFKRLKVIFAATGDSAESPWKNAERYVSSLTTWERDRLLIHVLCELRLKMPLGEELAKNYDEAIERTEKARNRAKAGSAKRWERVKELAKMKPKPSDKWIARKIFSENRDWGKDGEPLSRRAIQRIRERPRPKE